MSPATKTPQESVAARKTPVERVSAARIRDAAKYIPLERLALSTQCGFASEAKGNSQPPAMQELVEQVVGVVADGLDRDREDARREVEGQRIQSQLAIGNP